MLNRFLSNREFRVKMVRTPKDEFAPEEDIQETEPTIDPVVLGEVAKDVVTHTVSTIVKAFLLYKTIDIVGKIIVKKI